MNPTNRVHRGPCRDLAILALGICTVAAIGCGGTYDAQVRGTVTFDGELLNRGTVMFAPVGDGPSAYAQIEPDGSYSLKVGADPSLPSGEYRVAVVANEPATASRTPGGPPIPGPPITPAKYRSKQTSGLKETVKQGKNTIDLILTSEK